MSKMNREESASRRPEARFQSQLGQTSTKLRSVSSFISDTAKITLFYVVGHGVWADIDRRRNGPEIISGKALIGRRQARSRIRFRSFPKFLSFSRARRTNYLIIICSGPTTTLPFPIRLTVSLISDSRPILLSGTIPVNFLIRHVLSEGALTVVRDTGFTLLQILEWI